MDIYYFAEQHGIRTEDYLGIVREPYWDAWEYVVHELAHAVTLGTYNVDMDDVENSVASIIREMDSYDQDDNEVLTCAVELEVMSRFKSPEYKDRLVAAAATNLKAHKIKSREWVYNQLEALEQLPEVQLHADRVVDLLGTLRPA